MKPYTSVSRESRSCLCSLLVVMSFVVGTYFIGSTWLGKDFIQLAQETGAVSTDHHMESVNCQVSTVLNLEKKDTREDVHIEKCNDKCRPVGSEALPKGIVSTTSNLEMIPFSGPIEKSDLKKTVSLLAVPVGIKQKRLVNEVVKKFLKNGFAVMLFHYDGIVDEWRDMEWNDRVVHVAATNQTKWWFAKRFLHPDIVADYEYVFLWDEDLGVENFHPGRYISIIKEEGLEISQPALDPRKSKVHHRITVRNRRSRVHRRYYGGSGRCDGNSTTPPCVGWVEMMAPVFSGAAWRCVWHMIQNDLIHAWGLDMQLGYCAQGDRAVKVGVVDEEYLVHLGLPILGGHSSDKIEASGEDQSRSAPAPDKRYEIRMRSYDEMKAFKKRWNSAVEEDDCWVDPFLRISQIHTNTNTIHPVPTSKTNF